MRSNSALMRLHRHGIGSFKRVCPLYFLSWGLTWMMRLLTPNPPMDGVRTLEGGEEVTDAMVRARIRVGEGLAAVSGVFGGADGGLQWLW